MIIVLDGPAGSGKSSTARAVARRLGYPHLDSGAFYRALTAAALDAGVEPAEWDGLTRRQLDALGVEGRPDGAEFRLFAHGRDLTGRLRDADVNANVSLMARVPAVRQWLLDRLRAAARTGNLVADGRDMGTVVFPHADLKFFVIADPQERARRRLAERGVTDPTPEQLLHEAALLVARDRIDTERDVAPLLQAPDAILLDTTRLTFEEQVETIARTALSG